MKDNDFSNVFQPSPNGPIQRTVVASLAVQAHKDAAVGIIAHHAHIGFGGLRRTTAVEKADPQQGCKRQQEVDMPVRHRSKDINFQKTGKMTALVSRMEIFLMLRAVYANKKLIFAFTFYHLHP